MLSIVKKKKPLIRVISELRLQSGGEWLELQGTARGLLVPFDGSEPAGDCLGSGEYEYQLAWHPKDQTIECYKITVPGRGFLYLIISTLESQDVTVKLLGKRG